MALWPFRKRSKTNSGEKRPAPPDPPPIPTNGYPVLVPKPRHPSANSITQKEWVRRSGSVKQSKRKPSVSDTILDRFPVPPARPVPAPAPAPIDNIDAILSNSKSQQTEPVDGVRLHKRNTLKRTSSRKEFDAKTQYLREMGRDEAAAPPSRSVPFFSRTMSVQSFRKPPNTIERDENGVLLPALRRHTDRPTSDNTVQPRNSMQSLTSIHSSLRAFKVRSLDVLSPRPRLQLSSHPPSSEAQRYGSYDPAEMRGGNEWRKALREPITEEPPSMKKNRVYGLADDLDSRDIRAAMERDDRRRDRREQEQAARAQVKLERKAEKQRQEADEAAERMAHYPPSPARLKKRGPVAASEAGPSTLPTGKSVAPLPSDSGPARPTTSGSLAESTGSRNRMSWKAGNSQEQLATTATTTLPNNGMKPDLSPEVDAKSFAASHGGSGRPSPEPEYPDESLIHTAKAVRLSQRLSRSESIELSPGIVRSPTLVHHTPSHSRNVSREISRSERDQLKKAQGETQASTWTSFFRKPTPAKPQTDTADTAASPYRSQDPQNGFTDSPTATIRGPQRLSGTDYAVPDTPDNTYRAEHKPNTRLSLATFGSPSPRASDVPRHQGTGELGSGRTSPLPAGMSPMTPTKGRASRVSNSSPIRTAPISTTGPQAESPGSRHYSTALYQDGPSSSRSSLVNDRGGGISRSMASLDSEGSWLSGRLGTKRSISGPSPILGTALSLRHQYRDLAGHEDRRASAADDDYFSGVPPGVDTPSSGSEEERAILESYADDEEAVEEVAALSPVLLRPTTSVRSVENGHYRASSREVLPAPGTLRDGLGRKPTITRVDAGRVKSREGLLNFYDGKSEQPATSGAIKTSYILHQPMAGELFDDPDTIDRGRNSPSPTLGADSPRFVTPMEYPASTDPFERFMNQASHK